MSRWCETVLMWIGLIVFYSNICFWFSERMIYQKVLILISRTQVDFELETTLLGEANLTTNPVQVCRCADRSTQAIWSSRASPLKISLLIGTPSFSLTPFVTVHDSQLNQGHFVSERSTYVYERGCALRHRSEHYRRDVCISSYVTKLGAVVV